MIEILITGPWAYKHRIEELIQQHNCKLVTTKSVNRKKITMIFIIKGGIRDIIELNNEIGFRVGLISCNKYTVTPY